MSPSLLGVAAAAAFASAIAAAAGEATVPDDVVDYVQLFSGTYSHFDFGTGSQLPFVGRPWGMNNWAVQSNNRAGAWVSVVLLALCVSVTMCSHPFPTT